MAVYRKRLCPLCNGRGWLPQVYDGGASSKRCGECDATGHISVAITNLERIHEITDPIDMIKFIRGFNKCAKYAGKPLRLINPEEIDDEMTEWLNKISDETDDFIFENR